MHGRRVVAAVAGVAGAALAHVLDVAGLLPFVHETADVRGAMSAGAIAGWLAVTAVLAAAAARRPATVGAVVALVVGGLPELAGRHDVAATVEPTAVAGALLQWLLLMLVLSVASAVHDRLSARRPSACRVRVPVGVAPHHDDSLLDRLAGRTGHSRAPPLPSPSTGHPFQRGLRCTEVCAAA